jgi:propanol-preferring alcohol dehydrogenase
MRAMVLEHIGGPLVLRERPDPQPGPLEIRVRVGACGVCRTDLHVLDGELADPRVPIVPGHEIVGRIDALGAGVEGNSDLPVKSDAERVFKGDHLSEAADADRV